MLPLPDGPLLLCGDFNTHSPCWSPPELPTSPWAHTLKDWLDTGNLISLILEGSITQRGTGRASLIDHIFVNMAILENPFFPTSCSMSFEWSISSDHAALFIDLPLTTPLPTPPHHIGWIIKDQMEQEWKHVFSKFPCPLITDILSLSRASTDLINLTHNTCDRFFAQKKTHGNRGLVFPLLAQSNSKLKEKSQVSLRRLRRPLE